MAARALPAGVGNGATTLAMVIEGKAGQGLPL